MTLEQFLDAVEKLVITWQPEDEQAGATHRRALAVIYDELREHDQPKPASVAELFVCNKCGYAGGNSQHEGCNYFAAPTKPVSVYEIVSVLRRWGDMEEIKDVPESLRRMAFADMRALADWIETQMNELRNEQAIRLAEAVSQRDQAMRQLHKFYLEHPKLPRHYKD